MRPDLQPQPFGSFLDKVLKTGATAPWLYVAFATLVTRPNSFLESTQDPSFVATARQTLPGAEQVSNFAAGGTIACIAGLAAEFCHRHNQPGLATVAYAFGIITSMWVNFIHETSVYPNPELPVEVYAGVLGSLAMFATIHLVLHRPSRSTRLTQLADRNDNILI